MMYPALKKMLVNACQLGLLLSCMPAQSADLSNYMRQSPP